MSQEGEEDQPPQYAPPPPPFQAAVAACARKHQAHCAVHSSIVTLSKELLDYGVRDLLRQEEPRLRDLAAANSASSKADLKASSFAKILLRMILSIIRLQEHEIEKTFLRLVEEYLGDKDEHVVELCEGVFATSIPSVAINHDLEAISADAVHPPDSFALHYSEIRLSSAPRKAKETSSSLSSSVDSADYRQLVATQGIGRGIEVLQERPYVFAMNSSSDCLESLDQSALLHQHVHLAFALFQQRHRNPLKLNYFLRQFTSGLPTEQSAEERRDSLLGEYSFASQCLMAMLCGLFTYFQDRFHLSSPEDPTDSILARAEDSVTKASLLLEILSRLPLNTHAVSTVIASAETNTTTTTTTSTVEKKCLGLAVFLQASAINHSCNANAIVKYSLPSLANSVRMSLEEESAIFLKELRIVVLANQSIARDEEISICYGPRASKHSYQTRQKLLRQQYLFECTCQACRDDFQRIQTQTAVEKAQQQLESQTAQDIIRRQFVNVPVEDIKALCRSLEDVKQVLEMINVTFSEVLNITRKSTSVSLLQEFEAVKLSPLQKQLLAIACYSLR